MSTTKKTTTKKAKPAVEAESIDEAVLIEAEVEAEPVEAAPVEKITCPAPKKRVQVDLNDIVYVQSCFHGNLFYKSKRNGSIVEWQRFGEDQPMDVDELMYMRNTQPTFFKEQWVRLVGDNADDVFNFLHLDRYCKNNLKFDSFDDVFEMTPSEIESTVKEFAPSLRESVARRAKELCEDETLTDIKTIKAIERATGFTLLS